MAGIFISYRRDDSGGEARRIWDGLARRFGADQVFIDSVTLEPGEDFVKAIHQKVAFCDVVVAVIGPGWLDSAGADGRRRLDDPEDWVRVELAAALEHGIRLVPALVRGARLPDAGALPEPLAALTNHQAIALRPATFERDVERLGAGLARRLPGTGLAAWWLALITRRHRAVDPLSLQRPEAVWRALGFLLVMLLIGEILRMPAGPVTGPWSRHAGYLAIAVVSGAVEWLAVGAALHLGMRALGGHAPFQASIAVFCFLSAWLPLIALSQAPVWGLKIPVTQAMADIAWDPADGVETVAEFVAALGTFGTVRLVASFLVASALWLTLLTSVFAALRTLHGLRGPRALAAFGLGLAAGVLFVGLFYAPMLGGIYAALGLRAP